MDYKPREIEQKWKKYWEQEGTYQVAIDSDRPKYYVLDMFPYPSGVGLHVGHPEGYTGKHRLLLNSLIPSNIPLT